MWMNGEETEHEQLIERGQNKDSSANHDRIILTHKKLRIKITKSE